MAEILMQKDGNGNVALKRYTTIPKVVKIKDVSYVFRVQANICMAWVREEHVAQIMAMMHNCHCGGGSNLPEFRYANESDVRRWTNKGGA